MKALIVATVLSFLIGSKVSIAQNVICQKNTGVKKTSPVVKKRKPLPKLSKKDSLLNEREFRVEEDESTKDLDLELSKMNYSPKVVVEKKKDGLAFYYFKNMSDKEIEMVKQKLLDVFKGEEFNINPSSMNCKVAFKQEASEEDKNAFFREFGYDGIIYH